MKHSCSCGHEHQSLHLLGDMPIPNCTLSLEIITLLMMYTIYEIMIAVYCQYVSRGYKEILTLPISFSCSEAPCEATSRAVILDCRALFSS